VVVVGRGRQRVRGDAARVAVPAVPVGHYAALGRLTGTLTGLPGALATPTAGPAAAAATAAVTAARAAAAHRYDRVRPLGDRLQVRGQRHYGVPEPRGSWKKENATVNTSTTVRIPRSRRFRPENICDETMDEV